MAGVSASLEALMSIVSLSDAKDQLNIDPLDSSQNADLQAYVDGITAAVERYLNEVVEQREVTEQLRLDGLSPRFLLAYLPAVELVSMAGRDGSSVDPSGLDLDTDAGIVEVLSGTPLQGRYTITYQAGYQVVPENYIRGALVILQHVYETQRGVMGVSSGIIGAEEQYDPRFSYTIPRKALEWLGAPRPVVG